MECKCKTLLYIVVHELLQERCCLHFSILFLVIRHEVGEEKFHQMQDVDEQEKAFSCVWGK